MYHNTLLGGHLKFVQHHRTTIRLFHAYRSVVEFQSERKSIVPPVDQVQAPQLTSTGRCTLTPRAGP